MRSQKAKSKRQTTTARVKKAASACHYSWSKVERENVNPLLDRQLVVGTEVMLARILLKQGCIVPLHHHSNEQLSYVMDGELRFEIGGESMMVRSGEVMAIPPDVPHLVEALRDTVSLDIFYPPRTDWINKTDTYLRK
jgi:quercetin dioxygenase-like cupin family protein